MEITVRDAITVVHGMGFGALLLLLFSGSAVAVHSLSYSAGPDGQSANDRRRQFGAYFAVMALLAWLAVFAGAYIVYPWYRAHPPVGTMDLASFPKALLTSSPATSGWHDIGMEWKEHIAWLSPICLTAVTVVVYRYGAQLRDLKGLRSATVGLLAVAFLATGVAGFIGAMLNKYAPVRGGATIVLMKGETHDK